MGKIKQWWCDNWFEVAMFGLRVLGTVGMIFGAYVGAKKGVEQSFNLSKANFTITNNTDRPLNIKGNIWEVKE